MNPPETTLAATLANALEDIERTTGLNLAHDRLIVGVSGGPDSLALLHALRHLLSAERLIAAYLDHGLRPESAAESNLLRDLCASWGVVFRSAVMDVSAVAAARKLGIEEAGRLARYRFLADVARDAGARAIVTGHHAGDQEETILMHLLRGTGLAGLRGMPLASPLPLAPDIWLARPFLQVTRATIEQYCRAHGLQPVNDASNQDTTLFRNRLRHELLPLLESYNPQFRERLQHLAAIVTADYDLLADLSNAAYDGLVLDSGSGWVLLDRDAWRGLALSLRRSTLRMAHQQCAPDQRDLGFAALDAARLMAEAQDSGRHASLPGNVTVHVLSNQIVLTIHTEFPADFAPQLDGSQALELTLPGAIRLAGGWALLADLAEEAELSDFMHEPDPWTAFIALDVSDSLIVRGRMPGETMQPLGLDGHSTSLKEIMIDRKVPAALRNRWPLVATPHNAVWLAGHMVDHRHRVLAGAGRVVRLRCRREAATGLRQGM